MDTFEIEIEGTYKFITTIPYETDTLEEAIELAKKEKEFDPCSVEMTDVQVTSAKKFKYEG